MGKDKRSVQIIAAVVAGVIVTVFGLLVQQGCKELDNKVDLPLYRAEQKMVVDSIERIDKKIDEIDVRQRKIAVKLKVED